MLKSISTAFVSPPKVHEQAPAAPSSLACSLAPAIAASLCTTSAAGAADVVDAAGDAAIDPTNAVVQAFLLTFVSEIGDKTFFIAAILAAGGGGESGSSQDQRLLTFIGAILALVVMTLLAVSLGQVFHAVPDVAGGLPLDDYASILVFGFFGVKLLLDGSQMEDDSSLLDEKEEAEEAAQAGPSSALMQLPRASPTFCLLLQLLLPGIGRAARVSGHKQALLAERSHLRAQRTRAVEELYPFYHTTQGIREELAALASRCPGMSLETRGQERPIDVVTVRAPNSQPVNKNFALFGEHSRELISPESGLHLVKTLCGETELSSKAAEVLKDSEFQIVVNGNPGSREKVEEGHFCLRTNPDGVDLNRNWDEEWQAAALLDPADTNPGPRPFSEPETRVFKELVERYQPTTFLTVHSGTKGMYMPWAFDMEHLAQWNQPQMMQILRRLDQDHCQCPFGAAGKEVGYSCPGTCLDWVYAHLKTPYAFAFEIYTGPQFETMLRERWQEKMKSAGAFYQAHSHLAHEHFRDLFADHPSSFVQVQSRDGTRDMTDEECFALFNPGTAEEYKQVIDNWTDTYLDMATSVASNVKNGISSNTTIY